MGIVGSAGRTLEPDRSCRGEDEGLTWQITKEAVLPLGKPGRFDAGLTGSVCVLRTTPNKYEMWHSAGERYAILDWISPGFNRGVVHVGHAVSRDGVHWTKDACPVLSPRLDSVPGYEAVVSKPEVILRNGIYHMWLSVFTMNGGYRLNHARSKDGIEWERFADEEILPLSPGRFDAKNQSYASVIEIGDEIFGDETARVVTWRRGHNEVLTPDRKEILNKPSDLSYPLHGQTVQLRFVMESAELYSFRLR